MRWTDILDKYDVTEKPLELGSATLRLACIADINALVDSMGPDDFGEDERLPY